MTSKHHIYLVDVFTDRAYAGNPLAVVTCSEPLPEATMQRIAACSTTETELKVFSCYVTLVCRPAIVTGRAFIYRPVERSRYGHNT
jgi:hypothetical protein